MALSWTVLGVGNLQLMHLNYEGAWWCLVHCHWHHLYQFYFQAQSNRFYSGSMYCCWWAFYYMPKSKYSGSGSSKESWLDSFVYGRGTLRIRETYFRCKSKKFRLLDLKWHIPLHFCQQCTGVWLNCSLITLWFAFISLFWILSWLVAVVACIFFFFFSFFIG